MEKKEDIINSRYRIKNTVFKNRLIMPAIGSNFSDSRGAVTPKSIHFYEARADGGVGAIVHEHSAVDPLGRVTPNMSCIYDDCYVDGFKELVGRVKASGCRILLQLNHAGRQTLPMVIKSQPVGPSAVPCPRLKEVPRELSVKEIDRLSDQYAGAAARAMAAGFDGVEIQMGHGYLICQFLSPYANQRQDEYGGSLENRLRFALEVVEKVRRSTGPDFLVFAKISAEEYVRDGLHLNESLQIAGRLQQSGIDCLTVSACNYESSFFNIPVYYLKRGKCVGLARKIKAALSIPVVGLGKIDSWHYAGEILSNGGADFVALGRALIADPLFIQKSRSGRFSTIRPCLRCNHCLHSLTFGQLECAVNPRVGREQQKMETASRRQKIFIIGGGAAGLNAGIYARQRGHRVTIYDRGQGGGQLNLMGKFPCKQGFRHYRDYLIETARRAGAAFRFNCEINRENIDISRCDRLIFCCGARPDLRVVEGLTGDRRFIYTVDDLDRADLKTGRFVVIGGGQEGCEAALYLAEKGNRVTIIEKRHRLAVGLEPMLKYHLERRLKSCKVTIVLKAAVIRILPSSITYRTRGGEFEMRDFDFIVAAVGRRGRELPIEPGSGSVEVKVVGDQKSPGKIRDAVHDAYSLFFPDMQ